MAARAIVRIEGEDQSKAQEFAQKKAAAEKQVASAGRLREIQDKREYERKPDISGTDETPEATQSTQADVDGLKKKEEARAATCSKPEGCKTEQAVLAAIHEAKKSPTEYSSPESAAASNHSANAVEYSSPESAAASNHSANDVEYSSPESAAAALDEANKKPTEYASPESAAAALATPQQPNCTARVWAWSYLWKVDAPGVKNAEGKCVPINP
jgi:hypothetical protein